jgi:phosphohistidine phosphatase
MPQLIVIRHAKAVDRMEAEDDFERGLTERGREDAARASAALKEAGLKADLALVSPARRTRETWRVVGDGLGAPPVQDPMALYHATFEMLQRAVLEALSAGAETPVLVGHNPGVGAVVHSLAAQVEISTQLPPGWPTGAAAAFELSGDTARLTATKCLMLFNPKTGF